MCALLYFMQADGKKAPSGPSMAKDQGAGVLTQPKPLSASSIPSSFPTPPPATDRSGLSAGGGAASLSSSAMKVCRFDEDVVGAREVA